MAKEAFYAVRKGKEPGIYKTWADCEAQVKGFPGAEYKKFNDEKSAKDFISPEQVTENKSAEVKKNLIPEEEAGEFKFDSSINVKRGKFVNFCDSSFNLTEYYSLPYEDKNNKGELFVREGDGQIFATRDGVDHRYTYGQPVDDIGSVNLRPLIEKAAGYDFDVIVDAADKQGAIDRDKLYEDLDGEIFDESDKDVVRQPSNVSEDIPKKAAPKIDIKNDAAVIYVDGSYNADTKKYGYGVYLRKADGSDPHIFVGVGDCEANGRNVEGEVAAARVGLWNAKKMGYKDAVVFHDYQGIGSWGDGEWKTNKNYTSSYSAFVNNLRDEGMNIKFVHVDGHTGDVGNEYVDKLAKIACGVPITASERDYIRQLKDVPGYPRNEQPTEDTIETSLSDNGLTF